MAIIIYTIFIFSNYNNWKLYSNSTFALVIENSTIDLKNKNKNSLKKCTLVK